MKYLLAIAATTLIACTSTKSTSDTQVTTQPTAVTLYESSDNDERFLTMKPSILGKSGMKLSLKKRESMRADAVLLVATLPGKCEDLEANISFDIDGTYYFFPAKEDESQCHNNPQQGTTKTVGTYLVDLRFIETVLRARQVHIILGTTMGTFSKGGFSTAQYGFKEFLAKVNML
ncbi:MAG: hypothetical protein OCC49_02825 [Fibrobacterales bacterium]